MIIRIKFYDIRILHIQLILLYLLSQCALLFILVEHCDVLKVELALEIKTFKTGFVFVLGPCTNYC